uniref:group 10 secretory phospholipase A2 isoform X1 n=1 Tax=Arvicanthis niloticus TaxID=61156 RepID=UPI0014869B31|nr:group 10 secretory phospholipase A2 isoform X1 [Arvicanthis niloticus]
MLLLLLLSLLGPGPRLSEATRRSHVFKRGLLELAGTLDCVGPRSPMAYMNYGCYCGLGGHGEPRDTIDWCCLYHDCCYSRAQDAGCSPKLDRYSWKCMDNRILCELTFYIVSQSDHTDELRIEIQWGLTLSALRSCKQRPTENKCQELLCRCDEELAYCLAGKEYHLKYLFFPSFLCEKDSPKCD